MHESFQVQLFNFISLLRDIVAWFDSSTLLIVGLVAAVTILLCGGSLCRKGLIRGPLSACLMVLQFAGFYLSLYMVVMITRGTLSTLPADQQSIAAFTLGCYALIGLSAGAVFFGRPARAEQPTPRGLRDI